MRGTITLLQYEHGIIRQVTDVLSVMVKQGTLAKHQRQVTRIASFMDSYVTKMHHQVEERFLFKTAMAMSADLAKGARALMDDHAKVNGLISRLKQLSSRKQAFEDGTLAFVAKELVEAMTQHIRHEEDIYYPKVEEALSMEKDAELLMAIDEFTKAKFDREFVRTSEDVAIKLQDEVLGPGYYQGIR
ncbi:MAG: hemerythrin domain-containing protein [Methanomassiliicoccales archaeon]|nr:hemerythrin domain-containing protein [Methanomassiliicoccales archaeon]MDD1755206.1 hemerythrin domain-containing protein [Methanomassiliicoccales archaeon]